MKVGGYDGGFEARVGCSFFRCTSLLSALGPNGPGQMGQAGPGCELLSGHCMTGCGKSISILDKVII